jgi:phage terminase large subunit-like protein
VPVLQLATGSGTPGGDQTLDGEAGGLKRLELKEDAEFYYDEAAAMAPVRFAEKFLRHYEGQWAGQPFTLMDWQRDEVIKPLFGWKRRKDGRRRFRELWLLTAKGAGKTPLLALVGMFMLLADGEEAPHIISSATDVPQARLTFDAAKKYIAANRTLERACRSLQHEIKGPKNAKWEAVSGSAEGRHGYRPTCLLMDEAHEWPNGALYKNLTANMFKRPNSLTLVTTNAGPSRTCFAWSLHERALAVLNGTSDNTKLLPVIYETPEDMDWTTEAAAKVANPSIGHLVQFEDLATELSDAKLSDDAEARYRRLYLSQWQKTGEGRWLSMALWDACETVDALTIPTDAALFVGLDLSLGDDLCAVAFVWATPERFYLDSHFWTPKATAEGYEASHGVPYQKWANDGHITLVDELTISGAVHDRIAAYIVERAKGHKVRAICFDRAHALHTVKALEAAGLRAVPIGQGYEVSPGCFELERRIKESTVTIRANGVLRFCATNAEIYEDQRGNIYPIKPGAKGKFKGTKHLKIDGISAAANAFKEAKRHTFPKVRTIFKGPRVI